MTQTIKHKRSTTADETPNASDLSDGEIAINVRDGKMFFKKTDADDNDTLVTLGGGSTEVATDTTPQLGGDLESNGKDILIADTDEIKFGAGNDMRLYSNGHTGYIDADKLFIDSATVYGGVLGLVKRYSQTAVAERWLYFKSNTLTNNNSQHYQFQVRGYVNNEDIESHVDYTVFLHYRGEASGDNAYDLEVIGHEVGSGKLEFGVKFASFNEFYIKVPEDYSGVEVYDALQGVGSNSSTFNGAWSETGTDPTGITFTSPRLMVLDDGAGNVNITGELAVNDINYPTADGTANQVLVTDGQGTLSFADQSGSDTASNGTASAPVYIGTDSDTGMFFPSPNTIAFSNGGYERLRLNSSGKVGIGVSSPDETLHVNGRVKASTFRATSNGSYIYGAGNYGGAGLDIRHTSTTTIHYQNMISFNKSNGGVVGSIKSNAYATQFNTSSDERLKENIQDATDAGAKIDSIQIRQFDWKGGGYHVEHGVIAQELLVVAPEAVSEGYTEDDMMGVDYSKLVPTLIKEVQSLRNRVAELENN